MRTWLLGTAVAVVAPGSSAGARPPTRDATRVEQSIKRPPGPDSPWVGSSRGNAYYATGCRGAAKLSRSILMYFRSGDEAKKAGYRRSRENGC